MMMKSTLRSFVLLSLLCSAGATAQAESPPGSEASAGTPVRTPAADFQANKLSELMRDGEARATSGWAISLKEALDIALSQSPQVRLQEMTVRVAERRIDSTYTAYRPTISANAGIELTTGSGYVTGSTQLGGSSQISSATSVNIGLSASQLIYDFGRTAASRRAAQATLAASQATQAQTLMDIRSQVLTAYLSAGAAREKMLVSLASQRAEQTRSEQIEAYVQAGLRPSLDLAVSRANTARATASFIDAQTDYELATFELLSVMGLDEDEALHVQWSELDTSGLENLSLADLQNLARSQRGEFLELSRSIVAAEENLVATERDLWPTLTATAGVSESYIIDGDARWNAYIGARIGWTLYQGGETGYRKAEQAAEIERLRAREQEIAMSVVTSIRRAQRNIQGALAAREARAIATDSAARQLELAQERYRSGLGNIVELSDAQLAFTEAQYQEIEAALRVSQARVQLISSVAGWQDLP